MLRRVDVTPRTLTVEGGRARRKLFIGRSSYTFSTFAIREGTTGAVCTGRLQLRRLT